MSEKNNFRLLETKEMRARKEELNKFDKDKIIKDLISTEETLKFYVDLYNKEKKTSQFLQSKLDIANAKIFELLKKLEEKDE